MKRDDRGTFLQLCSVLNPETFFFIMNNLDGNLGRGCYYCHCWTYGYCLHIVGYALCYMWYVLIFMRYFRSQIISTLHYCPDGSPMTGCSRIREFHDLKSDVKASVDLKRWPRRISEEKSKLLNMCNWRFHFCINFFTTNIYAWPVTARIIDL